MTKMHRMAAPIWADSWAEPSAPSDDRHLQGFAGLPFSAFTFFQSIAAESNGSAAARSLGTKSDDFGVK